jgi:hypothetical protein
MGRAINPAPGSRKTVLRGAIVILAAGTSQTATIPSIDTTKGDLRLLGARSGGGGGMTSTDWPTLDLTNSTTITATRQGAASGQSVVISWEMTVSY